MAESHANFTIAGVGTEADALSLEDDLEDVNGVMGATVDPETGDAEVRYDEDLLSGERVKDTVRDAGYDVD